MTERRARGERHDSGVTKKEIIRFLFESGDWVSEPDIREDLTKFLGIIEPKSSKIQLSSLLSDDLIFKDTRRGVNYWKINLESESIAEFVLEYLSSGKGQAHIPFFYNSRGMQQYLDKHINWDTVLSDALTGYNFVLNKDRVNEIDKTSLLKEMILPAIRVSPTLFISLTRPNVEYLLLSNLLYLQIPDVDEILIDADDPSVENMTLRDFYEIQLSIASFVMAGMFVDYFQYSHIREKIIAHLFDVSTMKHYFKFDQILKKLIQSMPNIVDQIYLGSQGFA